MNWAKLLEQVLQGCEATKEDGGAEEEKLE